LCRRDADSYRLPHLFTVAGAVADDEHALAVGPGAGIDTLNALTALRVERLAIRARLALHLDSSLSGCHGSGRWRVAEPLFDAGQPTDLLLRTQAATSNLPWRKGLRTSGSDKVASG